HDVRAVRQPWEAESLLSGNGIDVVVVGDSLSQAEGRDLLKRHGGEGGPDFILICRPADLVDKVLALELGAADVVESPLNVRELAARIGGLLARRGRNAGELVVLENATVDLRSAMVMHRSGTEEQLSPGQVALLRLFLASPRKVLTRDDIIAAAPAENADAFDRSIDSRIVRLRRKLDTETITTIRGAGYRFDPPTQFAD
ncbi:MAG: response regulator transcription factor, partial [Mesorhizobium sp.]